MSNLSGYILNGCTNFVHLLFPMHCALCGTASPDRSLCIGCWNDLPHHSDPACPVCALPTLGGDVCGACLQHAPAFGRTLAAFTYGFPVDRLLQSYKYSGNLTFAKILAEPLARLADPHPRPDLLLPMPLHAARLKQRGFNQALEIARPISHWLGIPLAINGCERTRDTPTQAGLKWKERRRNVRGAFACNLDLSGKKVAVVDDVMTTGATLDELSDVLRRRGATEVSAWVVARTLKQE